MLQSVAHWASGSETRAIDPQTIRDLVELWFKALDARQAEVLVDMCDPAVVIRPYRARQADSAPEYRGHSGVRDWVDSLEEDARIVLELIEIQIVGSQCAVVEADVWFDRGPVRSGGLTFSVWRFDNGKLCEAVGYGSRDEAFAHARPPAPA